MDSKQALRAYIRRSQPIWTQQEYTAASERIVEKLKQHPRLAAARTLLLYYPLPDEVDTRALISQLAAAGKQVLLPKVTDGYHMEMRRYTGPGDLHTGAFGIMEPTGEPFTHYTQIDVAIVPGMAFDKAGHRLGRGKGYYDRFLNLLPHTYKIGICFPYRLLDNIPADRHDIAMDEIISRT